LENTARLCLSGTCDQMTKFSDITSRACSRLLKGSLAADER
jgi:hypothetical protein